MFKTRGLLSTISVLFFLAFTNISHAQYLGPGEMKADTSVSQIMTKPTDGQQVLLKGYIIKRISKKYKSGRNNMENRKLKLVSYQNKNTLFRHTAHTWRVRIREIDWA